MSVNSASFGEKVINYYLQLPMPRGLPEDVEVLDPFSKPEVQLIQKAFYTKYYPDKGNRTFLIGINPGRLGAGITGIPFTDPVNLTNELGIENTFDKKHELSSRFIYEMISACGGAEAFYRQFYITSVSPVGFVKNGKNLNYYDEPELQSALEVYMKDEMKKQLTFGASPIAYSLGMGKNIAFLKKFNQKYKLFEDIRALPHPRWVMQYRLKKLDQYIGEYREALVPLM